MKQEDLPLALTNELISFTARVRDLPKDAGDEFSKLGAEFVGRFTKVAEEYATNKALESLQEVEKALNWYLHGEADIGEVQGAIAHEISNLRSAKRKEEQ